MNNQQIAHSIAQIQTMQSRYPITPSEIDIAVQEYTAQGFDVVVLEPITERVEFIPTPRKPIISLCGKCGCKVGSGYICTTCGSEFLF
jgi:hypothetical protein